jgi:hypothetical protein
MSGGVSVGVPALGVRQRQPPEKPCQVGDAKVSGDAKGDVKVSGTVVSLRT